MTDAQRNLLHDLSRFEQPCSEAYKPAQRLVALGLAEWRQVKYGQLLSITPAGRSALEEHNGK